MTIRAKLVLAFVLMVAASGAASLALVRAVYARSARVAARQAVASAAAAYADLERSEISRMGTIVDLLAAHPAIRDAFAARDRARLQAVSLPIHAVLKREHGIGHWNYVDADTRRMFLRVHLPEKHDDVIERPTILKAIERREASAGKELGKSAFALRVGKPLLVGGRLVGYLELGEELDVFLHRMKQRTGDDLALFVEKRRIDASEWARTRVARRNGWDDLREVVVVEATTAEPLVDEAAVDALGPAGHILDDQASGERVFARGVFPVRDSSGAVLGGLLVRHDLTDLHRAMGRGVREAVAFFVALAALAALAGVLVVDRVLLRRLRAMTAAVEDASMRLAGGDYEVAAAVRPARDDELGRFEAFFASFLAVVGNTLRALVERSRQQRPAQGTPPAAGPAAPAPRERT